MGRRMIEVMQLLVDQIHKAGYQHRALEDDIYAESQKRIAVEKDRDHWRQARQDAMAAGELMQAEILHLRQQLAKAQQPDVGVMRAFVGKVRAARDCYEWPQSWNRIEAALAELDGQPAPVAETTDGSDKG